MTTMNRGWGMTTRSWQQGALVLGTAMLLTVPFAAQATDTFTATYVSGPGTATATSVSNTHGTISGSLALGAGTVVRTDYSSSNEHFTANRRYDIIYGPLDPGVLGGSVCSYVNRTQRYDDETAIAGVVDWDNAFAHSGGMVIGTAILDANGDWANVQVKIPTLTGPLPDGNLNDDGESLTPPDTTLVGAQKVASTTGKAQICIASQENYGDSGNVVNDYRPGLTGRVAISAGAFTPSNPPCNPVCTNMNKASRYLSQVPVTVL